MTELLLTVYTRHLNGYKQIDHCNSISCACNQTVLFMQ